MYSGLVPSFWSIYSSLQRINTANTMIFQDYRRFPFPQSQFLQMAVPKMDEVEGTTVKIRNLDSHVTTEQIQHIFSRFGDVIQTKIMTDRATGLSKGYAFVQYSNPHSAENAIKLMNNAFIGQSRITVKKCSQEKSIPVKVMNLDLDTSETDLEDLFGEFGGISSVKVMVDKVSRISLGYGFVNFFRYEDAVVAFNSLNGIIQNSGRPLLLALKINGAPNTQPYVPKNSNTSNLCAVKIKNLNSGVDGDLLSYTFREFKSLANAVVMRDRHTGRSLCYGFLNFSDEQEALLAIAKMNGIVIAGKKTSLSMKKTKETELNEVHTTQEPTQDRIVIPLSSNPIHYEDMANGENTDDSSPSQSPKSMVYSQGRTSPTLPSVASNASLESLHEFTLSDSNTNFNKGPRLQIFRELCSE